MFKFFKINLVINLPLIVNPLAISTPQVSNNPSPGSNLKKPGKNFLSFRKYICVLEFEIYTRSKKVSRRASNRLKMEKFRTTAKKDLNSNFMETKKKPTKKSKIKKLYLFPWSKDNPITSHFSNP